VTNLVTNLRNKKLLLVIKIIAIMNEKL